MPTPGPAALNRLQTDPAIIPNVKIERLQGNAPKRTLPRLAKRERVPLTQDKAAWFIDLPVLPGERLVTDGHVQELLDKMSDGTFNPENVIIATVWLNGRVYKVNGQNTCWAKLYLPNYTPIVEEQTYEADDAEQAKLLYSSFDANKPRTQSHLLKVQLSGEVSLDGLWPDTVNRFCTGLRMWHYEKRDDARRAKAEHIAYLAKDRFPDLMKTAGMFWQSLLERERAPLKRSPCFAALLATFYKDAKAGPAFWHPVATGADLKATDPRLALRNYLLTSAFVASGTGKRVISQESMFWCCLSAWNKWRANNPVKVLVTPSSRPVVK